MRSLYPLCVCLCVCMFVCMYVCVCVSVFMSAFHCVGLRVSEGEGEREKIKTDLHAGDTISGAFSTKIK